MITGCHPHNMHLTEHFDMIGSLEYIEKEYIMDLR